MVCEYFKSRSFFTFAQGHVNTKIKIGFSQKPRGNFLANFICEYLELKIYWHDAGHMTKMATKFIYGKNPSKVFFSGTSGPILTKLGM